MTCIQPVNIKDNVFPMSMMHLKKTTKRNKNYKNRRVCAQPLHPSLPVPVSRNASPADGANVQISVTNHVCFLASSLHHNLPDPCHNTR